MHSSEFKIIYVLSPSDDDLDSSSLGLEILVAGSSLGRPSDDTLIDRNLIRS